MQVIIQGIVCGVCRDPRGEQSHSGQPAFEVGYILMDIPTLSKLGVDPSQWWKQPFDLVDAAENRIYEGCIIGSYRRGYTFKGIHIVEDAMAVYHTKQAMAG